VSGGTVDPDRGDWIPWYVDDSAGWLELSLAARGAAEGIARKMGPRRGELRLGSRGLRGLALLLGCSWEELEPALAELLSGPHPRLVLSEDQRVLIDPDHESRRRPTSADRVRRHRAKRAGDAGNVTSVTPVSGVQGNACDVASRLLSSDLPSDLSGRSEDPQQVTAREAAPPEPLGDAPPSWWADAAATAEQTSGLRVADLGALWLEYRSARERKGWQPSQRDAVGWLASVARSDARRTREGPPRRPAGVVQSAERRAYVLPPEMP